MRPDVVVKALLRRDPALGAAAVARAASVAAGLRGLLDTEDLAARVDPLGFGAALGDAARAVAADPLPAVRATVGLAAGTAAEVLAAALYAVGLVDPDSADPDSDDPDAAPDSAASAAPGGDATAPGPAHRDRAHGDRARAGHAGADDAWEQNAWYRLCRREHGLVADWARTVTGELELGPAARRKVDFLVEQAVAAGEPANWPWSNPAVAAAALTTGGASAARGARNMARDVVTNRGLPRQVPPGALVVGRDLAATPGRVVFRNRLMELIQFEPRTDRVHAVPLLLSPPWINKYYVMDLAPGRSFAQWAVEHGHTVFAISYRNPGPAHRDVTMSDYLREGPLTALDVVREITGAPRVDVAALCLGGTLAVATAAWLAARGQDRIGSLTLLNTLLDFAEPGPLGVFTDARSVARLDRRMRADGYLPAGMMKATFDALRPGDLVWRYVIEGWLLGRDPAAFDLLAWNADSTRMPAAMQTEYLRTCYLENRLVAGTMELAGERLDLAAVRHDTYVVSAQADHIAPWASVYAGARRLGGPVRFVLSNSGHIAGVVNPPSRRSVHRVGIAPLPASAPAWRAGAPERAGSWWEDWASWAGKRAGDRQPPPPLGSDAYPVLGDAPGGYVLQD